MIHKNWSFGRVKVFAGLNKRWGVEVTVDFEARAFTVHLLNVWLVIEVW
jgi:hypothetical protein